MRVQFVFVAAVLGGALVVGCAKDQEGSKEAGEKVVQIEQSQVPANVMAAFKKDHPNVTLTKAKKETYANGTIHYELEWKDAAGKEHEAEYSAEGEKLEAH